MKSKLILVAGPSSSGKSTLAQALCKKLGARHTRALSLDHYYHDLRHLTPELNAIAALKIFVDLDDNIALQRRLERDIRERGRTPECITRQFNETVRPANEKHIRPSAKNADLVLNGNQPIKDYLKAIGATDWGLKGWCNMHL